MSLPYKKVVLDIEGTICPISFVKEQLYPYFLENISSYLSIYQYPLTDESGSPEDQQILDVLLKFPEQYRTAEITLLEYIKHLVSSDIKDTTLKTLQGYIWERGYNSGEILAPLYEDAIEAMKYWSAFLPNGIFIYSSGSVRAQKLLFSNVKIVSSSKEVSRADLNGLISGYFDTVNIGNKKETESYKKIIQRLEYQDDPSSILFLSDDPNEVKSAINAGLSSYIVTRPGNSQPSADERARYNVVSDFQKLF
ncbi:hypothetical protein FOA43_003489 [Brettanomyces nanus]|uniref:Enolase-phosphatase E1 n=1 Tax=Eeniella nana TaxID=13502 RepID=A0A875S5A4_EENNA|nr:uncharacterized protein FOA43_003489 [Brettanomyces nanus]QPG76103.1 hypothetical protein FOA43_003489 [Brettanomyces nanus]